MAKFLSSLLLTSSLFLLLSVSQSATLILQNNCDDPIWPGLMSNAGRSSPPTTGLQLERGEEKKVLLPPNWSGRLWARTQCTTDASGKLSCVTGDCETGEMGCSGRGATPPATLVEFTLGGDGNLDFYDVSLVDGYNVPITVVAKGGRAGNCSAAGCETEINRLCPVELRKVSEEGTVVACRSACDAFRSAQYCCSGEYANPNTCHTSSYSKAFKKACPGAYSYAYDDSSSTFTCSTADSYLVSFCPSRISSNQQISGGDGGSSSSRQISSEGSGGRQMGGGSDASILYLGGDGFLSAAAKTHSIPLLCLAAMVASSALRLLLGCL